jgi:hypothetical protein
MKIDSFGEIWEDEKECENRDSLQTERDRRNLTHVRDNKQTPERPRRYLEKKSAVICGKSDGHPRGLTLHRAHFHVADQIRKHCNEHSQENYYGCPDYVMHGASPPSLRVVNGVQPGVLEPTNENIGKGGRP